MSIQRTKALFERLRHPFSARHVQLLAREYISPNFIRLTLGGPARGEAGPLLRGWTGMFYWVMRPLCRRLSAACKNAPLMGP